jgi:Domain of unknown function (DUF3552).
MEEIIIKIVIAIICLLIGALIGYIYRKNVGEKAIGSAEQKARNLVLDAENKSENIKKKLFWRLKKKLTDFAAMQNVMQGKEEANYSVQKEG